MKTIEEIIEISTLHSQFRLLDELSDLAWGSSLCTISRRESFEDAASRAAEGVRVLSLPTRSVLGVRDVVHCDSGLDPFLVFTLCFE